VNFPAGHAVQTRSFDVDGGEETKVDGGQFCQSVQSTSLRTFRENVPVPQALQSRFDEEVKSANIKVPSVQLSGEPQTSTFGTSENVPPGHASHARFVVSVGGVEAYSPIIQTVDRYEKLALVMFW
jgi:hypothetical protein